ncbi:inverse autotransporter beta domain-containing protein [Citrobacter sp. FP75]|uniref:inverse autotransporter beta domain-containing protein n=1 Tax=Citrobacter sp. FP75 TaxID=1852949 RepID=UPI001BC95964|nr:inverse autotransporter beta domain-containing protein [Citrobacter sp. FP75]
MSNKKISRNTGATGSVNKVVAWSTIALQALYPALLSFTPTISHASAVKAPQTAEQQELRGLSSFAAQAGRSIENGHAGSFAANTVSAQATKEVVEWLQQYGNARIQLNVDESFSLKDSAFDFLYPWVDTKQHVLFSQTSLHRTDDRTQTNIGMGYRYFTPDNSMLGANLFYDYDLSRHHARMGAGIEYWRDYLHAGANAYLRLSKWKDSHTLDDYQERPADGWDIYTEGWLPSYPQLGASLKYEKYYGKNVGLFGSNHLQENPYAFTGGITYTPVPLVTFSAEHKQGESNTHDSRFGIEINYRPGIPLAKQLDSDNVAVMREVQHGRYDFVERNNNIVLEYRKKSVLKISLPESVQGEGGTVIPVTISLDKSRWGIQSVEWNDSAFTAAGGRISGSGTSWQLTLPAYTPGGTNHWQIGATARDVKGNVSNYAVMNVTVTGNSASVGTLDFTLNGEREPSIAADGQSQHPVTLVLKDANSQPLTGLAHDIELALAFTPDAQVNHQRSAQTPTLGDVQETRSGVYTAMLTPGLTAGTARITAKVLGKTETLTVKLTAITAEAAKSTLTVAPVEQVVGYPINLALDARDKDGNAITGDDSLRFYAVSASGEVRFTAVEEKDGVYTAKATSELAQATRLGVTSQKHDFSGLEKPANWIADKTQPVIQAFNLTRDNALADGKQTNVVKVALTDRYGNALSGYTVSLALPSQVKVANGESAATTDTRGEATFSLISSTPGTYELTLNVGNITSSLSATFASAMKDATLSLAAKDNGAITNIAANGRDGATLEIKLDNATMSVAGQKVELIVEPQGLVYPDKIITNKDGYATVTLTTVKAGNYTVKARATDGQHSIESSGVELGFVPDINSAVVNLTAPEESIVANASVAHAIQVRVVDGQNNPFSGDVRLTSEPTRGLKLEQSVLTLDEKGMASTTFIASEAGNYQLRATFEKESRPVTTSQAIEVLSDLQNASLAIKPSVTSAVVSDVDNVTFTLHLTDTSGNNVSNRKLKITATGPSSRDPLVIDNTLVTTDESGTATVNVHGKKAGNYTLTATLAEHGSNVSANASLTLNADAQNPVLTVEQDFGYVVADLEPVGFMARLRDKFGNPLNGSVEFSAGSKTHPGTGTFTMTPDKTSFKLGNAYSELRTDTAGESWVKVKATTGTQTLEKELTIWVVENHKPKS